MIIRDTTTLAWDYSRCDVPDSECPHGGVCRRREPGEPGGRQSYGYLKLVPAGGSACENRIVKSEWLEKGIA